MKELSTLLNSNDFLKTLFESMPSSIAIVDQQRQVKLINQHFENHFRTESRQVINQVIGKAIGCHFGLERPQMCGLVDQCLKCQLLNLSRDALAGKKIERRRVNLDVVLGNTTEERMFLVSAAPIEFDGEQLAVVMLEDITDLYQLKARIKSQKGFAGMIGQDLKMLELYENIQEVAHYNVPVLIQGESGTGKELVAGAIHTLSRRAEKPYIPVNCGAIPENLLESELFGHVRGAFTGAFRDKKGRFEMAHGGTIFLDEVSELSLPMQVKLLRVLQEGTFERVGSETTTRVDVRVISATNKNLKSEVTAGRFREDLYYRLCVMPFQMPPLRDRKGDIPLLAQYFLETMVDDQPEKAVKISPTAIGLMLEYHWPGNVRELQNAIQYGLVKCRGSEIQPQHLPLTIAKNYTANDVRPRRKRKRKLTTENVREALKMTAGNKVKTAELLGVSRATLYRFIEVMET